MIKPHIFEFGKFFKPEILPAQMRLIIYSRINLIAHRELN